jgi:peptide/nickel transport system permease protein
MTEIEPATKVDQAADVRLAFHLFRQNPLVLVGLVLSVGSIVLAVLSPFLVDPHSYLITHPILKNCWNNPLISWGNANIAKCPTSLPLGTDSYGRNLLSMIVLAVPVDLRIALEVVLSAVAIGIFFGAIASYAGGIVDEIILRVTDIFLAVPGILLAIVFMVVFGRTLAVLTTAVAIIWWPTYVRLVRSQALSEKEKPYVESLRAIGAGRTRILFRHIVPNSIYPLLVQATLDIGSVILTISALTFIGLSPSPLLPELGNLANLGSQYFFTAPWLIIFPGLTILMMSLGFNLLGDGLRDILDPRLRR